MVRLCGDPCVVTVSALVPPLAVSVAVQTVPAGIWEYTCDVVPAGVPAGMTKSANAVCPQVTEMTTAPCCPAAAPVMVLLTNSEPTSYVSVRSAVAVPPGGIVTTVPLPVRRAVTSGVCPSWVSSTVQTDPAAIGLDVCDTGPGAPAGITNGGGTTVPLQVTTIRMGPCCAAAGPVMVLV